MHVGEKIRYWRKDRRFMSIRGLAKVSGVKPTTISDIENGKRTPRHETLESLAKALRITLDDLADTNLKQGRRVA